MSKRKFTSREVRETARMLYALEPFPPNEKSILRWQSLARQAYEFLDNLSMACVAIQRYRSAADAAYQRAEKRNADAAKWPDVLPFDKAIRLITREAHTNRAQEKFETFTFAMPRYFGGGLTAAMPKIIRRQLAQWRKNGMSRDEVMELQSLYDNAKRTAAEKRQAKQARKRRKQWQGERIGKTLRKTVSKFTA